MSDELIRAIGRLEGKVDGLNDKLDGGLSDIKGAVQAHDGRIGSLEHSRSQFRGVIAAVSALGAMIGAGFTLLAKKIGIA